MKLVRKNREIDAILREMPAAPSSESRLWTQASVSESAQVANRFLTRACLRALVIDGLRALKMERWEKSTPISREIHCDFAIAQFDGLTRSRQERLLPRVEAILNRILKSEGIEVQFQKERGNINRGTTDILLMSFCAVRDLRGRT